MMIISLPVKPVLERWRTNRHADAFLMFYTHKSHRLRWISSYTDWFFSLNPVESHCFNLCIRYRFCMKSVTHTSYSTLDSWHEWPFIERNTDTVSRKQKDTTVFTKNQFICFRTTYPTGSMTFTTHIYETDLCINSRHLIKYSFYSI